MEISFVPFDFTVFKLKVNQSSQSLHPLENERKEKNKEKRCRCLLYT